ncbi:MAG: nucleotidyl transferase AbiEii/AbiGii toxin family protein [Gammaproteobacteria bacterium]
MNKNDGLPASIQARLQNHAKTTGLEYNRILERYALERYLYRLSKSKHADRFVLKGALLMLIWLGETVRPTRDADLLGFGNLDKQSLQWIFQEACLTQVVPDGLSFLTETLTVEDIRVEDPYGGRRVTFIGMLGNARIKLQVDVGIGDAVSPEPDWLDYPSLLNMPTAHLRAYRPETTIAEKFQAMVVLGSANSRMKDFFDIAALAQHATFDGGILATSLETTFKHRKTELPAKLPVALTAAFSAEPVKQRQWNAFIERNKIKNPAKFDATVETVRGFLWPVVKAVVSQRKFKGTWPPGGSWV